MKFFSLLIHLLLIVSFLVQGQAQASTILLPNSPEVVKALVQNFNKLSQAERQQQVLSGLSQASENDRAFFAPHVEDLKKIQWPDLQYEDDKFSFVDETTKLTFEFKNNILKFNGEIIVIAPDELQNAFRKIEKSLQKKSTSVMDLFISPAYALPVVLIALVTVAFAAFILAPAFDKVQTTIAKVQCHKIMKEIEAQDVSQLTQRQADELMGKVRRILAKTREGLNSEKCSENPSHCSELKENRRCYEVVEAELDDRYGQDVNRSGRGSRVKDFFFGTIPKSQGVPARGE